MNCPQNCDLERLKVSVTFVHNVPVCEMSGGPYCAHPGWPKLRPWVQLGPGGRIWGHAIIFGAMGYIWAIGAVIELYSKTMTE